MYILDTNIISNFADKRRSQAQLRQKILSKPIDHLFVTVISVQEMMKGSLARVQRHQSGEPLRKAYKDMEDLFDLLHSYQRLSYTDEAEQIFQSLPANIKRIGTQDCRIAAIAHTTGMTIITANINDFAKIGIAPLQDWT